MPTLRERLSDTLLRTGVELAADREQMTRSLHTATPDQYGYELANSVLLLAKWFDSTLLWLSVRLRPK